MQTILYIEDDLQIQKAVITFLTHKNYNAIGVSCAQAGMDFLLDNSVDLVLLDLSLPDFSGEELCMWIKKNTSTPVIMVTAKIDEEFVVKGFDLGAHDYIKKPFGLRELLARIESVLRVKKTEKETLSFNQGALIIDEANYSVQVNNQLIQLTNYEFKILKLLATHPQQIFSRSQLIEGAFGFDYDGNERTIDSHIKNLRVKMSSSLENFDYISTLRGVGYQFKGERDET